MLTALEDSARKLGIRRLVLETGPRQLEALALYRRAGFVAIPRFGEYTHSELSLCMGKGPARRDSNIGRCARPARSFPRLKRPAKGQVHPASPEGAMLAILQSEHAVIEKTRRTAPDHDIAVDERHAPWALRAADSAKQEDRRQSQ